MGTTVKKEPKFVIRKLVHSHYVAERGVTTNKKYARQFNDAEAQRILTRLNRLTTDYVIEKLEEEQTEGVK